VPSFRTHALAGPTGNQPFVLNPPGSAQANPFWVVGAAKDVIDGHGGIWQTPFLLFIATLLFQHVQASQKGPAEAGAALGDEAIRRSSAFRSAPMRCARRPPPTRSIIRPTSPRFRNGSATPTSPPPA
jgi:hypothetical protein